MPEVLHSYWSASGFEAARLCPGKRALEADIHDSTNEHAASGTASHQLLTWALRFKRDASYWVNTTINLDAGGRVIRAMDVNTPVFYSYKIDRERADRVQIAIDYVRETMALDDKAVLLVDRKVNYARWLGVERDTAWGTLDIAIVLPTLRRLHAPDYKDGRGYVSVGNDEDGPNDQVALYALGVLDDPTVDYDIDDVVLGIIQPRLDDKPLTYQLSVEALQIWAREVAQPAVRTAQSAVMTFHKKGDAVTRLEWEETFLKPGDKQCTFCKAQATCPALRDDIGQSMHGAPMATPDDFAVAEFVPVTHDVSGAWLAAVHAKADRALDFFKSVDAEIERRLMLDPESVPGYKLVAGKQGNRSWSSEEEAEKVLKSMRLKDADMYDFKLISPTSAEKLAPKFDKDGNVKPTKPGMAEPLIGPRQWKKLQGLITRKPGSPHVAPLSDAREPLKLAPVVDDFDVVDVQAKVITEEPNPSLDAQANPTFDPNDFA